MSTQAQISANRANAQMSTGPASGAGKAKSSLNAVKTGLTGRTVLLPGDDAPLYEAHVSGFMKHYQPATEDERNLVQSLADTEWRLQRIPALEMSIYALGRLEFAELFPQEDAAVRKQLIEAKVFLAYQRQLNNLSIQESRLRRQREKDTAALRELQEKRRQRLRRAGGDYINAIRAGRGEQWKPEDFGFEFSFDQVKAQAREINPDMFAARDRTKAA